jgi:hypothetical protein
MLKRGFLLFFVIFSFVMTGCAVNKTNNANVLSAGAGGKVVNPYEWDFGLVKQGSIVEHDFSLENTSNNVLNITDVNVSCGCTSAQALSRRLNPKENSLIKVKFDSKGYSGKTQQFVYVSTDSVDNPLVRFIINAKVVN